MRKVYLICLESARELGRAALPALQLQSGRQNALVERLEDGDRRVAHVKRSEKWMIEKCR